MRISGQNFAIFAVHSLVLFLKIKPFFVDCRTIGNGNVIEEFSAKIAEEIPKSGKILSVSFEEELASSSSADSSSSLSEDEFGRGEENVAVNVTRLDMVNQKRHNGDIQQLWDADKLDGTFQSEIFKSPMRNALKSSSQQRWTRIRDDRGKFVIPYVINGKFNAQERRNILGAMDAIDKNTCIKFRPRGSELDYVDIQNRRDEGCYTQVGRMRGRQVLMLESGWNRSCGTGCLQTFPGCVDHATVIHELMHKIGLWHEQMRYDRDKHIKVHYKNIPKELHSQFHKISARQSTTFGVPYDYASVMHYAKDSGAKRRGLITMETLDKKYQNVIGMAKDASPSDYRKICSMYQCSQCMGKKFSAPSATATNNNRKN